MIFKTITDDLGNSKLSLNQTVKDLFNGNLFREQSILSENDINCLKAYNAELERGISPMTAYYRTMQTASNSAVNMAQSANGAIVSLEQIPRVSRAAELGLKALSLAGNIAVSMLVVGVIKLVDNLIHKSEKERERLEKIRQKTHELAETYKQEQSDLDSIIEKYKDLNEQLTNASLTTEEYNSIKEQLSSLQDDLVSKYGEEASAIDVVNGKYDEQIKKIVTKF